MNQGKVTKTTKNLENDSNFKFQGNEISYLKEELFYYFNRLVNVIERIEQENKLTNCMPTNKFGIDHLNSLDTNIPRMATIKETVEFLNKSAKKTNVKNCLTSHRIRQLALSNQIEHVRAGKKILINIDKLIEFLNARSISITEDTINKKYPNISRIEV